MDQSINQWIDRSINQSIIEVLNDSILFIESDETYQKVDRQSVSTPKWNWSPHCFHHTRASSRCWPSDCLWQPLEHLVALPAVPAPKTSAASSRTRIHSRLDRHSCRNRPVGSGKLSARHGDHRITVELGTPVDRKRLPWAVDFYRTMPLWWVNPRKHGTRAQLHCPVMWWRFLGRLESEQQLEEKNQSISQSINQSINQSITQSIDWSIDCKINQSSAVFSDGESRGKNQ